MDMGVTRNARRLAAIVGIAVGLASAVRCEAAPKAGYAGWTVKMMGVTTQSDLEAVRAAVAGKPAVNIAIAYSATSATGVDAHDDAFDYEMRQIASYLCLSVNVVRIPPQDLKIAYEKAVAAGDIVIDYRSYWDAGTVSRATQVIAANPDKLFILPYGEINGDKCPPTSTSLQGQARHADGTGYANLVNTIPLAYGAGGRLMRPLRRTELDTSTVSFVAPTAWTSDTGTTCPSAAAASVAAAYVYAAHGGGPSAAEIVRLLAEGAGLPVPSDAVEFSESALATLKSELAALTATDELGRRMLLYGNVLSIKGSLDLLTAERVGIYARDSFEGYAVNTPATGVEGWHGEGDVVAEGYSPPLPPGFPMKNVPHTKVLAADEESVRELPEGMAKDGKVDVMVCVERSKKEPALPADDVQLRIVADERGRLCLWHLYEEGGEWKKGWIPLSEKTYADGEWVRVEIDLDYTSNGNGDALACVRVNGSCQPTAHGIRSPTDSRAYGPWHHLARNRRAGGVVAPSEIGFAGTKVDDLLLAGKTVAAEHEGPTSIDGIEFAWFDDAGLPRDPQAAAPFVPGYSLGDLHTAGLDPYSDRPLEVTVFELDANGRPRIEFNGYKGENPAGYRILRSTSPDFRNAVTLDASDGAFDGDAATRSTAWSGSSGAPDATGFYKVEAVR